MRAAVWRQQLGWEEAGSAAAGGGRSGRAAAVALCGRDPDGAVQAGLHGTNGFRLVP